jgi:hypothetical protein
VFSGVDGVDRKERNGTHCAGANQVEGLVRDNRVEVRVLFGALHESPALSGLSPFSGRFCSPGATSRDNAL